MTILVTVKALPEEKIPKDNEGVYNWSREFCEGDALWPDTMTIQSSCVVLHFEEGENFMIPMHRIHEMEWVDGDKVFFEV